MITVLGLALGVVFLLLPLGAAYIYGIGLSGRILASFVKMLLRVGILGAAMFFLMQSGSVWLSLLLSFLILVYSTLVVCVKSRLHAGQFLIPVGAGMLVAVLVAGSLLLFANISMGSDFCVRYVLPVVALLSGGIIEPVGKSLTVYYMGLRHHNHLYYYMLGNGASRVEALHYLQRRAVMQAFVPGLRVMSAIGVGVSPVVMWTMLMCGRSAVEAACWQILIILSVFASSVAAVIVVLIVARRYVIDGYARIKTADGKTGDDAQPKPAAEGNGHEDRVCRDVPAADAAEGVADGSISFGCSEANDETNDIKANEE